MFFSKDADEELKLNIRSLSFFNFPDEKKLIEEKKNCFNLEAIKERMQEVIQVLCDFSNRRENGKSRADYLKIFRNDLCSYYSYNEFLMEKFMQLFPNGSEVIYFFLQILIHIHIVLIN